MCTGSRKGVQDYQTIHSKLKNKILYQGSPTRSQNDYNNIISFYLFGYPFPSII